MSEFGRNQEIPSVERLDPEISKFKEIKPEEKTSFHDVQKYWDDFFNSEIAENTHFSKGDEQLKEIPREEDGGGKNQEIVSDERTLPEIKKFRGPEPGEKNPFKQRNPFPDVQKFWDNLFDSEIKKNECFSTYDERLKQTPRDDGERGEWEGVRGESKFIPNDPEIIKILIKYGLDGIVYKDGIPDFSEVSESTVEIDNMTENRAENFKQCDEKCAEQWNKEARDGRTDWTARDVAQWRKENGYTWHERNDMKTCDLIPTKINDYFGHLGGVSECKKRDASNGGGDFDE